MIERFLNWLEKRGRKYVMIDPNQQVAFEKWVLIGSRKNEFWRSLPSVCLHRFTLTKGYDYPHNHIANFASFILSGGYWESIDGAKPIFHKRFSWNVLTHEKYHDITEALPNTWTLIFFGRRKGKLVLKGKVMDDVWHQATPELMQRLERMKIRNKRKQMKENLSK